MRGRRLIAISGRLVRRIGPIGTADIEPGIDKIEAACCNFIPERFIARRRHREIRLDRTVVNRDFGGRPLVRSGVRNEAKVVSPETRQ